MHQESKFQLPWENTCKMVIFIKVAPLLQKETITNMKILVDYRQLPGHSCLFKNLYQHFSIYYWNIRCKIYHQHIVSFWQLLGNHQLLFRSDQGHFIILQQQKILIPPFLPYHPYTSSPIINITPANLFFLSPQPTRPRCSLVKNSFNL